MWLTFSRPAALQVLEDDVSALVYADWLEEHDLATFAGLLRKAVEERHLGNLKEVVAGARHITDAWHIFALGWKIGHKDADDDPYTLKDERTEEERVADQTWSFKETSDG